VTVTDALIGSRRNLGLRDFFLATYLRAHVDELASRLDTLAEAMRSEQVRIPIRAFGLTDAGSAHALIESGSSVGKIVLHVDPAAATPRASAAHTQREDR
jgi:NADPH:quinone reductase-like Zn-dependent oxidoreductase